MLAVVINRWVQLAAGIAIALLVGFGSGYHFHTLQDDAKALKQVQGVVKQVAKSDTITANVGGVVVSAQAKSQANTTANLIKVRQYVTSKADAACVISNGAASLLNAGDGPALPATPGQSLDAASDLDLTAVVEANTINAGSFAEVVAEAQGWRDWYAKQAALYNSNPNVAK